MKKILYCVVGALVLWLAGVIWAIHWIDGKKRYENTGKYELAVTRFLWAWSPAIDREKDAERAMKFSWIRAANEVSRDDKKDIIKILVILKEEALVISAYLAGHHKFLSQETRVKACIQALTYSNRIFLFQGDYEPTFDPKLLKISEVISSLSPHTQEDWHREMMTYWRLRGNESRYTESKNRFSQLLYEGSDKNGGRIPAKFAEGVVDFYDGILLCVANKSGEAVPQLESAAKKLGDYPKYTILLWRADFNILLFARGISGGSECSNSITKVISLG
ncbi:MAG: hypothetical protein LBV44_04890 [Methylobacillus sp.]|jgi:hypothetical protein|nr:hypothetical protein [Methylobacillus sp.]